MSSIWKKMKIKKADIIMILLIAAAAVAGLIIAIVFREQKEEVILNGTTSSLNEEMKEGLSCSIEIRCDTILNNIGQLVPQKADYVPANGIILEKTTVNFLEGETVFEVLKRVCKEAELQLEYSWTPAYDNYYIEGINHIYEFDCGSQSGWMYKVNSEFPNYGCSSYTVEAGDEIVWCYTCEGLGNDVGAEVF